MDVLLSFVLLWTIVSFYAFNVALDMMLSLYDMNFK